MVFIEQPIKMDLLSIVTCRLRGKTMTEAMYWDGGQDTVFHLVSRHTGEVRSAAKSSTLVVVVVVEDLLDSIFCHLRSVR